MVVIIYVELLPDRRIRIYDESMKMIRTFDTTSEYRHWTVQEGSRYTRLIKPSNLEVEGG